MIIRTHTQSMGLRLSAAIIACCALNVGVAASSSGGAQSAANVTAERLVKAANEPGQWMTYGGTYSEQRFSPLKKIDASNVKGTGPAWFADYETNQNQHGSPLYIDGVIYVSTARNVVHAFDAKTGKQLWKYNPMIQGVRLRYNVGLVNRGIAAWQRQDHTWARWMPAWSRLTRRPARKPGRPTRCPKVSASARWRNHYSITMAPRVAKGKVFIGGAGGEFGVRGWIAAFDAETGKEVWRFWTVPGDPAKGYENKALEACRENLGRRVVEVLRRRRHRLGCGRLRSGDRSALFRHRQCHAVERAHARAERGRQPLCRLDRRGEGRHAANTCGTTRKRRATRGTTTR